MKRISNSLIGALIWILSFLPFWAIYLLSDILFVLLYHVIKYRKETVEGNLDIAFPNKARVEKKQIAARFYRHLADMILETVKMKRITAKEVHERFILRNPEEVNRYLQNGKPVIGLTAHYGNWELALHRLSLLAGKHPALVIYRPLSNHHFEHLLNGIRTRFGATMVPMKQTLRQIIVHGQTAHISMFVADQTPARSESNHFAPFFNRPTLVFLGVEKIARKTNFPVIYCHMDKVKRGHYSCTFEVLFEKPAETDEHEVTQAHLKRLEQIICEKPELWLWSHRRWKHQA